MRKIIDAPVYIRVEFLLLCVALPAFIIITKSAPFMFAFLWGATLYCYLVYRTLYFKGWRDIWRWDALTRENLVPIVLRWAAASVLMYFFLLWYAPDRLFFLISQRPELLLALFFLYPVISALPQEFIFCKFIFRRYERFFGRRLGMVWASAIIFAFAHILYINPVAPLLSLIGGYIFAQTYRKTGSLALVTLEHSLYGNSLFILGLGWYFYGGSVVAAGG